MKKPTAKTDKGKSGLVFNLAQKNLFPVLGISPSKSDLRDMSHDDLRQINRLYHAAKEAAVVIRDAQADAVAILAGSMARLGV